MLHLLVKKPRLLILVDLRLHHHIRLALSVKVNVLVVLTPSSILLRQLWIELSLLFFLILRIRSAHLKLAAWILDSRNVIRHLTLERVVNFVALHHVGVELFLPLNVLIILQHRCLLKDLLLILLGPGVRIFLYYSVRKLREIVANYLIIEVLRGSIVGRR